MSLGAQNIHLIRLNIIWWHRENYSKIVLVYDYILFTIFLNGIGRKDALLDFYNLRAIA